MKALIYCQAMKPSLYERLGGVYSIATVVDDLVDRVMSDARLNKNPLVDEAHHKVPPPGFKYLVTEIARPVGGLSTTRVARWATSHRHLRITEGEWAFMEDFRETLEVLAQEAARRRR